MHEPRDLPEAAAIEAKYPASLAAAWIAAAAASSAAMLVHKDPEFAAVPVAQEALPSR